MILFQVRIKPLVLVDATEVLGPSFVSSVRSYVWQRQQVTQSPILTDGYRDELQPIILFRVPLSVRYWLSF